MSAILQVSKLVPALVLTVCLLPFTVWGSDGPVASDPVFNALRTDGSSVTGRVREFSEGGVTLVSLDGKEEVIPPGQLVKLTREGFGVTYAAEPPVVLFPGGDRLHRSTLGAATETTLELQSFSLGNLPLAVPLDSLLGLVMPVPTDTGADAIESLILRIREEPRKSEVLWLGNGDRINGGFLGLSEKTVEFLQGKTSIKIDRSGVLAIGFEPGLVVYPLPKGGFFELNFTDGSRLGVTDIKLDLGQVAATTRFHAKIKVPLADLVRISARTPSVVYLTERAPAQERSIPYVGPPRPSRRDVTVEGQTMRLSGQDYDRGIGTQSRSLLAYRLEPGDKRFQTLVGVDDRAGPLGNVVFRVLVDNNQELYASPPMAARDSPRVIDVDVSKAKVLILITEFGERGAVRDIADWVESRIIR